LTAAGPGSSRDPCDEQYNGWQAFCEPETRAISDFISSLTSQSDDDDDDDDGESVGGLLVYVSLHSYGQHLLTPWGYTRQLPPDYVDLVRAYLLDTAILAEPGIERVQALADISRSALGCHETRAPIAYPPNTAQLEDTPYHSPN